jgi:hypothetical protein
MPQEYLMNIASSLFFICYIPEFYANIRNKNANIYNVFEKVVMLAGTGFGLGYSLTTNSQALVFNYAILFGFDTIALTMRTYYAYKNRNHDVRMLTDVDTHNPIQDYIQEASKTYNNKKYIEDPNDIIDPL